MKKIFLGKKVILVLGLIFLSSCSQDYIYYKSECACMPVINYADIKREA